MGVITESIGDLMECGAGKYEIFPEEEVFQAFPCLKIERLSGWVLQQLIKLSIAAWIKTPFYLTCDSDIVCVRNVRVESLMDNNRAFLNVETVEDYQRLYLPAFAKQESSRKSERFRNSARLLGYTRGAQYSGVYYGETPCLLSTAKVLELCECLEQRFGQQWPCVLSKHAHQWSEYSLYYQYLEMSNSLDRVHMCCGSDTLLDLERSVWHPSIYYKHHRAYDREHFVPHAGGNRGYFIAVQSWLDQAAWLPLRYSRIDGFYADLASWLGVELRG